MLTKTTNTVSKKVLNEATRKDLLINSKGGKKYKHKQGNRWDAKKQSSIANTVKDYNKIDMNTFWKKDVLNLDIKIKGETDDYVVTVEFANILTRIKNKVVQNRNILTIKTIYDSLVEALNSSDVRINCSCLFPGTHIPLLDGSKPTIEELLTRYEGGEDLWVYSTDSAGDFKPGHVDKVWITKTVTKGISITLDNGKTIRTTSDHLYLTRLGEYKPANELKVGESLMPLYIKQGKKGYELVKLNSSNRYHSIYKLVAEATKKLQLDEVMKYVEKNPNNYVKYDVAIHHIDFNKHNNNPNNLSIMTGDDHWKYHNSLKFSDKSKDTQNKIREKSRQTAIYRNANPTSEMINCRKAFIKKGHELAAIQNHDPEHLKIQAELMSKNIKGYWENLSDEQKSIKSEQRSLTIRNSWDSGAFNTEKFHAARKACGHKQFKDLENQKKMQLGKIKKTLLYMIQNNIELTEQNFNAVKIRTCPKTTKFFDSIDKATAYFELNHKIVSIEYFEVDETPVYDIKVADWHNFLVEDSVIVHNCPDFKYRFKVWATKNKYNAGEAENREAKITNPNNDLGTACKHILNVLNNAEWIKQTSSVINNYVNYCKDNMEYNYSRFIFPKIYGITYDKAVQLTLDDYDENGELKDTLSSDEKVINLANALGKVRGRIKKGQNKNPVAQANKDKK